MTKKKCGVCDKMITKRNHRCTLTHIEYGVIDSHLETWHVCESCAPPFHMVVVKFWNKRRKELGIKPRRPEV